MGEDHPHAVLATTMVAFAFSSILTGKPNSMVTHDSAKPSFRGHILPTWRLEAGVIDRLLPSTYPRWVRHTRASIDVFLTLSTGALGVSVSSS